MDEVHLQPLYDDQTQAERERFLWLRLYRTQIRQSEIGIYQNAAVVDLRTGFWICCIRTNVRHVILKIDAKFLSLVRPI